MMRVGVCGCPRLHVVRVRNHGRSRHGQGTYRLTADEFRVVVEEDGCREERNEGDK